MTDQRVENFWNFFFFFKLLFVQNSLSASDRFCYCLTESALDTNLNGKKKKNKFDWYVEAWKTFTSGWFKTAQGGDNGGDLVLFPL